MQNEFNNTPASYTCPHLANGNNEEWDDFLVRAWQFAAWARANEGWQVTCKVLNNALCGITFSSKATTATSWLHFAELLRTVPLAQVDGRFTLNTANGVVVEIWLD